VPKPSQRRGFRSWRDIGDLGDLLDNKVSKERTTSSQYQEQFVEYLAMALQQNQHSVIKPDPRPYQPLTNQQQQTQVPDGGAGWAFVLAAAVTIGAAALVRHLSRCSWNSSSRG